MKPKLFPVSPDLEIHNERTFDFPIEKLYEAWANPELLQQWWGPKGFTNTFHVFDFKVGGKWEFTMHGPEAWHYENSCEFTHIHPSELIAWKRYSKPLFKVIAAFEKLTETKTHLVFRQVFDNETDCAKVKKFAADKNEENFDRLQAILEKMN